MADSTASMASEPDNVTPFPHDPDKLFAMGRVLFLKRKYQEALMILKEAMEREPGEALYQSYYGLCLVETGRGRKEGLELCRQVVQRAFYHVELHINLARAHLSVGDKKRAILALKKGASLEPENSEVQRLLSEVGRRRKPLFPFLRRGHPMNKLAGQIRHAILGSPK
jgi:predicted Zn-dependent protease